jgi:endoglucanase
MSRIKLELVRPYLKAILNILVLSSLALGCITSPVWKYGDTKEAKEEKLEPCPNGLLDDGEDGDTRIVVTDGREGYWFNFVDPWGSTIEPKRFAFQPGGPGDSKMAANMHGVLAKSGESLYSGMGFAFTNPKTPFDISHAKGIRFWAKGPGKIRFKVPDRNTDPQGDRCTDCYNDFGVDIFLQNEWIRYTVPFDKMTQQDGWGDRTPGLDIKGAFAVQWQFDTAGAAYDIWVDNIELVGCTAPEAK